MARARQGFYAGQVARPGLLEQGGAQVGHGGCFAGVRLRICRFSLFEKLLKRGGFAGLGQGI